MRFEKSIFLLASVIFQKLIRGILNLGKIYLRFLFFYKLKFSLKCLVFLPLLFFKIDYVSWVLREKAMPQGHLMKVIMIIEGLI